MVRYNLNLITGPTEEPISKDEAKSWIKLDENITADDSLIEDILIPHARQFLEAYSHRALIAQTWEWISDCQYANVILPLGQLTLVNSVKVVGEDGTETTQSTDLYHKTLNTDKGRVALKNNSVWSTTTRAYDNFIINFTCGWATAAALPAKYKMAMLKAVAYMYSNRQYTDVDVHIFFREVGISTLRR
jgi:uncharacterized phiE125 gp8 family phage protein